MDEKMALAQKTLEANESKLRKIPGVVGVGLGWSEKGDVPAIHVYVDVESTGGTVPAAIPKRIDKVPVRIMKTDQIKAR